MRTVVYYSMRRMLGALARLLDRMDRREAERRRNLRAHPEGTRANR